MFDVHIFYFIMYIAGVRSWLYWRKELDVAADLLYFGLTTFGG